MPRSTSDAADLAAAPSTAFKDHIDAGLVGRLATAFRSVDPAFPATEFTELGTPTQLADWTVTVTDIAVTEDGVLVTYDAQYDGAEDFGNARVDLTFVLYDVEGTEHSINIEHDMETAGGSNSNGRYLPGETITREALFDDVDPALVSGGILHTEDLLMEDSADYAIA